MSLDDLRPLFELRGVDLFSLQRGPEAAELRSSEIGWRITDLERGPASPMRTAGAIRDLDLVVSVDTMIAHLAGALGVPVWALLPYAADWRWLTGRDDSPWYPTMRLFRQGPERAWDQPVRRMCSELARLIEDCGGTHP
jgi:ADP-heptose:LPS heptosyltransferase